MEGMEVMISMEFKGFAGSEFKGCEGFEFKGFAGSGEPGNPSGAGSGLNISEISLSNWVLSPGKVGEDWISITIQGGSDWGLGGGGGGGLLVDGEGPQGDTSGEGSESNRELFRISIIRRNIWMKLVIAGMVEELVSRWTDTLVLCFLSFEPCWDCNRTNMTGQILENISPVNSGNISITKSYF